MPKHIGIVACSAEGAALCYRTICTEAPGLMGRHRHPEISMPFVGSSTSRGRIVTVVECYWTAVRAARQELLPASVCGSSR
jgi:hypothetical protein